MKQTFTSCHFVFIQILISETEF